MAATGPSPPYRIADRNIELIWTERETRSYGHLENLTGRCWNPIGHGPSILINNSDDCVALFQCRGNCDGACVRADWGCAKQREANESVQLVERGSRSGFLFHRWSWLKKDVFTRSALKMSRYFRHCHFLRNPRAVRATNHRPRITDYYFCQPGVGRMRGVGRDRGIGIGRGVGVAVGVAVGVGVGLGVGVTAGPSCTSKEPISMRSFLRR
jgi:hypothetical protein